MTNDLKSSLDGFAEAAHADAPPSTIDIDRARADGRRRIAGARLASVGGGVAVVAVCALVVDALGGTSPDRGPAPAATAPAHRAFTGTDPLMAMGHFGWLPDGLGQTTIMSGPDYGDTLMVTAPTPAGASAKTATPLTLTLLRSQTQPRVLPPETKEPTTLAGSTQAYFAVSHGDVAEIPADLRLVWQSPSGAWYSLGGDYTIHGDALKARLTKVAESISYQQGPVPLPFHIEGLPAGVSLGEASLRTPVGHGGFEAYVSYHAPSGMEGLPSTFTVQVTRTGDQDAYTPRVTSSPDPVSRETSACKDSEGLHICVVDNPGPSGRSVLASVGGVQAMLDRITSLGLDRSNWTTNVVN